MIQDDVVEVMIALPGQLFLNTPVPVCLWFLAKDKTKNGRDRRGETLFIYARRLGAMETRVNRILTNEDVARIADTVHAWRGSSESKLEYQDVDGFCFSASLEDIEKHDFTLTPGRYVGAVDEEGEEEEEDFEQKMQHLIAQLTRLNEESARLDHQISQNLKSVGYEL
jgi:type I restriction enzyme M protein